MKTIKFKIPKRKYHWASATAFFSRGSSSHLLLYPGSTLVSSDHANGGAVCFLRTHMRLVRELLCEVLFVFVFTARFGFKQGKELLITLVHAVVRACQRCWVFRISYHRIRWPVSKRHCFVGACPGSVLKLGITSVPPRPRPPFLFLENTLVFVFIQYARFCVSCVEGRVLYLVCEICTKNSGYLI